MLTYIDFIVFYCVNLMRFVIILIKFLCVHVYGLSIDTKIDDLG